MKPLVLGDQMKDTLVRRRQCLVHSWGDKPQTLMTDQTDWPNLLWGRNQGSCKLYNKIGYTGYCLGISRQIASNLFSPARSLHMNSSRNPGSIYGELLSWSSVLFLSHSSRTLLFACGHQLLGSQRTASGWQFCGPGQEYCQLDYRRAIRRSKPYGTVPDMLLDYWQQGYCIASLDDLDEAGGGGSWAVHQSKYPDFLNRRTATVVFALMTKEGLVDLHNPSRTAQEHWVPYQHGAANFSKVVIYINTGHSTYTQLGTSRSNRCRQAP